MKTTVLILWKQFYETYILLQHKKKMMLENMRMGMQDLVSRTHFLELP